MRKHLSKHLAAIVCGLLISGFARGQQCTDLVSDGSFNGFNGIYNTNEFCWNVPTWEATNGSPQIGGSGAHTPPYYAYLWGAVTTGEGISTNVTVVSGRKYVLTYWYRKSSISAYDVDHIYVKLFPGTMTYTGCMTGPPPTNTPEQTIDHLTTISTTAWTMSQVCFTANNNYGKLALFPMSNNQSYAVWAELDDISLVELKADAGADANINCCASTTIGPSCYIPGATYSWSPTTGLSNPNVRNPVASPTTTTTYTLTVTGPGGCTATDQVTVTTPPSCPEFFQNVYGTNLKDQATDGALAMPSTFPGNAMVALSETPTEQGKINVTRTDLDGRFTSVYNYNNQYSLARSSQSYDVATVYSAKLVFSPGGKANAGEVMIMGDFTEVTSGPNHEIYFLHLDEMGAVTNLYDFSDPQWSLYLGDFKLSRVKPTDVYVTGWAERNDEVRLLAFKFDLLTSGIIWSSVYDISNTDNYETNDYGRDIIENPSNSSEVLIVGNIADKANPSQEDAILVRLNANTGAITSMVDIYSNGFDVATIERFTSINETRGQTGFIIGGTIQNADMDMWAVQTDASANMLWSSSYAYTASAGGVSNEANGIILERISPSSNVEFYQAGYATNGNRGGQDIVVYKLDAGGAQLGQFTYGDNNNDYGVALDIMPGSTTTDGLYVYGTYNSNGLPGLGDDDGSIIKAYFNGYTACNYEINDAEMRGAPRLYTQINVSDEPFLTTSILHCKHITPIQDIDICRASCVSGGNNNRVMQPTDDKDPVAVIIPNPMTGGAAKATIVVESQAAESVTVTIYDLLGREYYSGAFSLVKGKNTLPVDVSNANLAPGMYSVKIMGNETNRSVILVVK